MAAVSASTILLLTGPMLRPPENTWVIVGPDVTRIVEATGIANAIVMTTGTEIGTGNVTVTVLRVDTTGTVVTETRIGTGVTEGAPVANRLIVGGGKATPAVRLGGAQDVLVNVNVIANKPKILVVFCNRPPVSESKSLSFFKFSSFESPLPYCIKTSNSSCSVN